MKESNSKPVAEDDGSRRSRGSKASICVSSRAEEYAVPIHYSASVAQEIYANLAEGKQKINGHVVDKWPLRSVDWVDR